MDIDLENVNEQVGTAIIDSATSEIKKTSGDLAKEDGPVICGHILRIIKVSLGFECIHSMPLSRYHNLSTSIVSSSLSLPLQDSVVCIENQPLKRISIAFGNFSYITTIGDGFVYIVKVNSPIG